ncbi:MULTISPECIES: hypothetical protein [Yersinia pseudotuberculosis complex]|uniref:Uncharacterized protein n=1 Tax=Yersinia pseudotuberculosis TaxID=633 RepID=A0ABN5R0X7_YERPU|nr:MULTISPECIES: hypothetical protein [Yersinia pseudotuberculosis complex]AYW90619.1 hypothetical protein EGX47_04260 [Yersinia pseudotuberculosis]MBO1591871.1 hypothetical protein [Yersinia pseudotuberculosis]CNC01242.1 Uncharacterised protein [Yersinia similis]CNF93388.1 Uncharacterised protein [Yersinia pseudotuberculosis]VEE73058.1 Uncharacterised protein [Yersinia pseudotuberculosis]
MSKIKIMTITTVIYVTENEGIKQAITSSYHPGAKDFAQEYLKILTRVQPSIISGVVKHVGENMGMNTNTQKNH